MSLLVQKPPPNSATRHAQNSGLLSILSRINQRCWILAVPLIAMLLGACSGMATPTYFVPPTFDPLPVPANGSPLGAVATPSPEPSPPPTDAPPSPTPDCFDDLDYLQDLTVPDGSVMLPGQTVDKRWQVRNSGSCNWDQRYSLQLLSGDAMGAAPSIPLYPARAGSEATLQIVFSAPQAAGTYECQWQAVGPDGARFGDAFYMQIVVGA